MKQRKEIIKKSLDPKEYTWNKKCKKCYGRGFIGENIVTNTLLLCKCCEKIKIKNGE